MIESEGTSAGPRTEWPALLISITMPLVAATGFVRLASNSGWGWEVSDAWLYGLLALAPLEFIRVVALLTLATVYENSSGPREAVRLFLCLTVILAVAGLLWVVGEFGFDQTFTILASPLFYKVIALPVFLLIVDSMMGLATFKGDPERQAARLQAVAADSFEWLACAFVRIPVAATIVGLLAIAFTNTPPDQDNLWIAFVHSDAAPAAGFYYLALYFLIKAAIIGHAYTAQFEGSGKRMLECCGALGWLLGFGKIQIGKNKPLENRVMES
jgi:hypothetical protein